MRLYGQDRARRQGRHGKTLESLGVQRVGEWIRIKRLELLVPNIHLRATILNSVGEVAWQDRRGSGARRGGCSKESDSGLAQEWKHWEDPRLLNCPIKDPLDTLGTPETRKVKFLRLGYQLVYPTLKPC